MLSSPTITSAQPLETLHDFQLGDNGKLKNFVSFVCTVKNKANLFKIIVKIKIFLNIHQLNYNL